MLKVEKILNGKLLAWTYFVHDETKKDGFMIDPGYDIEAIDKFLLPHDFTVSNILLTHCHFDHMLATKTLVERYGAKVFANKLDEELLAEPRHNYSSMINFYEPAGFDIDTYVDDNETIEIDNIKIKCIWTPGHTKGGMSYLLSDFNMLFSGDTLFFKTYGAYNLYGGSKEAIKDSIVNKLFKLDKDIYVYPGHGKETTIKDEMEHNIIKE